MLAMSEDHQLDHENPFWDVDQSWAFPNLETEDYFVKTSPAEPPAAAKEPEVPEPSTAVVNKGKKRAASERKEMDGGDEGKTGGGDQSEDHELHIWTERERRKKMRNMFENLHSLLPHLPPKADKSTIVDEAVSYIKKMEQTLKTLEKKKLERLHGKASIIPSMEAFRAEQGSASDPNPYFLGSSSNNNNINNYELTPAIFKTWTSPNVILNVCGRDAQISICSMKKPGLLTKIVFVIDKYSLDVLSAHISSDRYRCMLMIHAQANGGSDQFQHALQVEEMYKQAAAEIMLWVNA
ncbi:hypothetical protein CASFOL_036058 [Castilleja foliolosa]|uniref:BHLH domain-containing protein n=1 Tax=Castilleja foliolosa TaxID=1961234 RepID=A0ABD3BW00_9LAMI